CQSEVRIRSLAPRGARRAVVTGAQISVRGLTKMFGDIRAVDGLTFEVRAGGGTGFLGPHGAGKTTTLRMLLGLVRPTGGTTLIGGRQYAELAGPRRIVGAVLEATGLHPGRTGRRSEEQTSETQL